MGKGYKKKRNKNNNRERKPKPDGVHGGSNNYIQMVTDRGNFRMEYVQRLRLVLCTMAIFSVLTLTP